MKNNTVIILGTRHLTKEDFPEYFARLRNIIIEINPDVICSELSPEQLEEKCTCNSKPEQRDLIMPLAKELKITILPIQPGLDMGLTREKEKNSILENIALNDQSKHIWKYVNTLTRFMSEKWREQMKNPECIENSQLTELHVFTESMDMTIKQYFPKLAQYYTFGNEYFLDKIYKAIERYPKKVILVICGLGHKYWLWNKLKSRNDIELHNLQSFRMAVKY